jgi:hypothetical protein
MTTTTAQAGRDDRLLRLKNELAIAVQELPREDLHKWGKRSALRLPAAAKRRVVNLGEMVVTAANFVADEAKSAYSAWQAERLSRHLDARGQAAAKRAREIEKSLAKSLGDYAALAPKMLSKPWETAPVLLGPVLGFFVGSGGFDGDGGLPDLDLAAGIEFHRSIFTHSIVIGSVAEAAIISLLDLTLLIENHLPADHDPLWDNLGNAARPFTDNLVRGLGAGIALHLAIDGTVDGMTSYKDLPFALPIEGHRAVILVNAAAEAANSAKKRGSEK